MKSEVRFYLKKPTGKRRSFSLVAYTENPRKYIDLDPQIKQKIDAINTQFKGQTIDQVTAELLVKELIAEEYRKANVFHAAVRQVKLSTENSRLLEKFWTDVYAAKSLADERSTKLDFERALRLIEPLSLYTADANSIKINLKQNSKNVAQQRRAIDRLREMLGYLKREATLHKPEADYSEIVYLTEKQVASLAKAASDPLHKALVIVLFGTGCRLGEALALKPTDVVGDRVVFVSKQLMPDGRIKKPKRGKQGKVTVIKSAWPTVKQWMSMDRSDFDRKKFYDFVVKKSREVCNIEIHPHCLRHSHAIHLLGQGANLTLVSLNLRNRIEVCQKYYSGFEHTNDSAELLKKLV